MHTTNQPPAQPSVVKIGHGKETHLSLSTSRPDAFCKGVRVHRAFTISLDLSTISCAKCRARAIALGLLPA